MQRFKPDPIPAIYPEPEYLVEGRRRELYDDTRQVLQVPWMGVVTMAMAHYQPFYEALWNAVRPMMASGEAVSICAHLRSDVEEQIASLSPPSRVQSLAAMGYAPREVDGIRDAIDVFSHGNFSYTMIATLARLALEEGAYPPMGEATPFEGRHAPEVSTPFVLMEAHHADAPTNEVYDSVKQTLGLPFVNTDYRALARWPSYFQMAWRDLAPKTQTPEYDQLVTDLHARFVDAALALPNPTGAVADDIRRAAEASVPLNEVLSVVQLFQWLLPGLITNVAFFRAQLRA